MKIKLSFLGLISGMILLASCDDDLKNVGLTTKPDSDGATVIETTFKVEASTIKVDSMYAKTTNAALGELYDPLYGNLKSDYICQFYCPDDFTFEFEPNDNKIDSVRLMINYSSWAGDSLAALRIEAFTVNKQLERHYYSNMKPSDFSDMKTSLGRKLVTPRDYTDEDFDDYSSYSIAINMPVELGQELYDRSEAKKGYFNQEDFNSLIPGIYITTTFGSGTIFNVDLTGMIVYYQYTGTAKDVNGNDSTYVNTGGEIFTVTKEVIQLNRFENTEMDELLAPSDKYTYVKSPAGVYTKLTIPTTEFIDELEGRTVNNFFFSMKAMPEVDGDFPFLPPSVLLLLPEDSLKVHFEEGRFKDNYTSFTAEYSSGTRTYDFGNIANIIRAQMEYAPDEDLDILLIPVEGRRTTSSSSVSSITSITNKFQPTGAQLRKKDEDGGELLEFTIRSSKFNAD